jgi:TorA maturation chaperone TorD
MKNKEIIIKQLETSRAALQSLADLYSFPGSEFSNEITFSKDLLDIKTFLVNNELTESFSELVEIFSSEDLEKLKIEYARLFVGPFHVVAPPYGSYYLENGKLMGDSTIEVISLYNQVGLVINESFKDLPDHIIAELEFLIYLTHNQINFIEKEEYDNYKAISAIKEYFIESFFNTWVKKFNNIIINSSEQKFFKKMANYSNNCIDYILNATTN